MTSIAQVLLLFFCLLLIPSTGWTQSGREKGKNEKMEKMKGEVKEKREKGGKGFRKI